MKKGELPLTDIANHPFYPNQFILIKDALGSSSSAIGIVDQMAQKVKKLIFDHDHIWGIKPRNVQQTMAVELLLRKDLPLVTLNWESRNWENIICSCSRFNAD